MKTYLSLKDLAEKTKCRYALKTADLNMQIILGKTQVRAFDPPNDGTVKDGQTEWTIGRNSEGMIVLRAGGCCHPEFTNGMDMHSFLQWINDKFEG